MSIFAIGLGTYIISAYEGDVKDSDGQSFRMITGLVGTGITLATMAGNKKRKEIKEREAQLALRKAEVAIEMKRLDRELKALS